MTILVLKIGQKIQKQTRSIKREIFKRFWMIIMSLLKLWFTSVAENNRLKIEIDKLRKDLESANKQLDFAYQVIKWMLTWKLTFILAEICQKIGIWCWKMWKEGNRNKIERNKRGYHGNGYQMKLALSL